MKISNLIEQTANKTARQVINELKRAGMIKESHLGSFKKTERILYEYPNWRQLDFEETKRFCNMIEKALDSIRDDPYFQIIELKYFQKWSHERIAEYYNVNVSVISKRRTKLINQLRPIIFSVDYIKELYEE